MYRRAQEGDDRGGEALLGVLKEGNAGNQVPAGVQAHLACHRPQQEVYPRTDVCLSSPQAGYYVAYMCIEMRYGAMWRVSMACLGA